MGSGSRWLRRTATAAAAIVGLLAGAGSASAAFESLPVIPGLTADYDGPPFFAGPVSGAAPANADVVGGTLTAGTAATPWVISRQETGSTPDQITVRWLDNAASQWMVPTVGTVGGRSSTSPATAGSLNFDQGQDGAAPAIDFAGPGRTVPWATWYENTSGTGFAADNIFASRFDNAGDANQDEWLFGGQDRGTGGGAVPVPSLNIHTDQDAENPAVAGGSTTDPTAPVPWVTWQETSTAPGHPDEIFVSRAEGPGMANCDGVTPAGVATAGHVAAIGGVCWQQTGIPRAGTPTLDPSLNVDPTRNGVEPDIAFAGPSDAVPWVVWSETGTTATTGPDALRSNDMVFAARAVSDGTAANGGYEWQAVGDGSSATLDATGSPAFGACAASPANESACSLNSDPTADAQDPQVAAGTMTPGTATVPWVAWDETFRGVKQIFVARVVGAGAAARFELVNGGRPISDGTADATRPSITFSANTPYVTWRQESGGGAANAFIGHFTNAAGPRFVLDGSDVSLTPTAQADVREPISSSCTANPFNGDGAACQGGALGTPFFVFTQSSLHVLSAFGYTPGPASTGAALAVGTSTATLTGAVDPGGARINAYFEYGTTTAYGHVTAVQTVGPDGPAPLTASLSGLSPGTTIHYAVVATNDFSVDSFGEASDSGQTFVTGTPSPPPVTPGRASAARPKVTGTTAAVKVSCTGGTTCRLTLRLTVVETHQGKRLVAVSARRTRRTRTTVVVGQATASVAPGRTATVHVKLNRTGVKLLAARHTFTAELTVTEQVAGRSRTISARKVTFTRPKPKPKPKPKRKRKPHG